jgi:3',5'-cyclic AMP phosphodiesterase CpdA
MMNMLSRKSFFKTMGILGAGSLLPGLTRATVAVKDNAYRSAAKKRILRVAHLTDIHVYPVPVAEKGFAAALHQVNRMADKPDLIINGGDAIMNAAAYSRAKVKQQWESFHRILKSDNDLPVYHCIGNHDLYGWAIPGTSNDDGKKWAMDEYQLQAPYYSFVRGGWKFIVIDSIHSRKSLPGYFGKIDEAQLAWLEDELRTAGMHTPVCIVSHIPILAVCTLFDSSNVMHNHWNVPDNCLHADAVKLNNMFFTYKNVRACLSGHIHLIDHVNYLGIDYYCNGAVSGGWWKGDYQQFAPAFVIINFYEDGTTSREVHYYDWKNQA